MSVVSQAQVPSESPRRPCPEQRGVPLLGMLPSVLKNPVAALTRAALAHPGEIVVVPLGPLRAYLVTHPPHVEHVLHTHWRNYGKQAPMWRAIRRLIGNGLASSEGPDWVTARRMLNPLFNHHHLASLTARMIETIGRSLDALSQQARLGRPIEMYQEMSVITQNVILETVFDVVIDRPETERLANKLATALKGISVLMFLPERFPFPGEWRLRRALAELDEGLLRMARQWEASPDKTRVSMLGLLREARDPETGEKLSPQQLRDEIVTMWSAGNETTATLLTWVWCLLDQHPAVDARLRAELAEVLGDRLPAVEDLPRLPYLKRVIQETLRMYSPSWIVPRQSVRDDVIDGYSIPSGATVLMSSYITHRTPSLWEEPERFDPDRFLPERLAGRHPYAFVAFGGGPRRCIGEHFSIMESQLILAMMAQRFRPRLTERRPLEVHIRATLRPKGAVMMALQPA